jgi:hypothetical protein
MWHRLRRNAESVTRIVGRSALRGKNLLGFVAAGAALVAGAGAVGAATGGNLLGAGWLAAMTGGALYGGLKSFLGNPWHGAAVLVAATVLVGGSAQALGVFDDTDETPAPAGGAVVTVDEPDDDPTSDAPSESDDETSEESSGDTLGHGYNCGGV